MPTDYNPLTPVSQNPPQPIILQQSSMFGRFGRWLIAAVVLLLFALIGMYGRYQGYFSPANAPQEKYHSLSRTAQQKIAILRVDGAILSAEDSFTKQQIDRIRADSNVVAIVLRIDSPGGSVTASDYLYHHLRKLVEERELPLVVSMGGLCASGGYYLAMAVGDQPNAVYAEPTTWTGSIGVVIPHYDLSGTLAALRIEDDSIASGKHKLMGTITRPMSDEDRQLLAALVDGSFVRFKSIVASGRPKFKDDAAALDAVATGQVFAANDALAKGLVDKIGFIEDAIARAAELANVDPTDVRCVKYDRPPSLFGDVLGASAALSSSTSADLATLVDLSTPRAYYLWSGLPIGVRNSQ
jgi:protease-4